MNWSKVKTILIVLLCLVNGFLFANLYYKDYLVRQQEQQLHVNLESVLQNSGVTVSSRVSLTQSDPAIGSFDFALPSDTQESVSRRFLGDFETRELGAGTIIYESEKGNMVWSAGGNFTLDLDDGGLSTGDEAIFSSKDVQTFFESHGFPLDSQRVYVSNNEAQILQNKGDYEIFNTSMHLNTRENGSLSLWGKWIFAAEYRKTSSVENKPSRIDILLAFIAQNTGATQISSLQYGFFLSEGATTNLKIFPVYKINTNSGIFYMDMQKNNLDLVT